ncbi:hypothetical protein [Staphylococcus pettenkoferi]|uniref:hypothetical protein n=1 Tax=Staphylococcus pettenkoferi TaxID=170573 RepID=UPI00119DAC87|nr:hypothetical protein [Staphylococcus pettenkoferi]
MNDDKLIGVVSELEEQMYETYLHGTKEQLKFLLENQTQLDWFDFKKLLNHANVDETDDQEVLNFSLDAIATPRTERNHFMDVYGVNYEVAREFSLQALGDYYTKNTSFQDRILDTFYRVINDKNQGSTTFITLEHLNEIQYEIDKLVKNTPELNQNSAKYKRTIWKLIKWHLNDRYDTPKAIKKSEIEDYMYYRIMAYIKNQLENDLQNHVEYDN